MATKDDLAELYLEKQKHLDELSKDVYLNNLFAFNKDVLKVEKGTDEKGDPKAKLNVHHKELCDVIQHGKNKQKLILMPRGHLKSTLVTVGYSLQRIAKNPGIRILIGNATSSMAEAFLGQIKNHLKFNKDFIRLFGDMAEDAEVWSNNMINLKTDEESYQSKEATATAYGIGGNLVSQHYDCLHPNTKVLTSNGYEKAKNIQVSNRVLTRSGKFYPVEKVIEKKSDKSLVSVLPQYQPEPSIFTRDHRVYVWRDDGFQWVEVGNLRNDDMLAIPLPKARNRQISKVNNRLNKLMAQDDIWRLIGYWLAEGCHTPNGGQIRMTFSDQEIEYVKDIEKIVKKHLGKNISYRKTKNSTYIICFSDDDFKTIVNKFGTKSYTKHLPPYFMNNSASKQRQLLIGYYRGDGSCSGNAIQITSTSLDLLTGIQMILAKLGIPAGIHQAKRAGKSMVVGNMCDTRDSWQLQTTHPLAKLLFNEKSEFPVRQSRSFFTGKYWVVPIRKIEKLPSTEKVYDIQVKTDHSFYCPGIIAHNCIILDDLHNRDNIGTKDQIEKVKLKFKDVLDLLEPSGELIIIGTRWHYDDLYGWLMEEDNPISRKLDVYRRQAVTDGKIVEKPNGGYEIYEGDILWPEKYSREHLNDLLDSKGLYEFNCQYQNRPIDDKNAVFQRKWFKEYEPTELKDRQMMKFTAIDPAISLKERADYTAIVTVGVDVHENIYILDIRRGHFSEDRIADELFLVNRKYRPVSITIETVAFQKALQHFLEREMRTRGEHLPLKEVVPDSSENKEKRIRSLQPYYMRGSIYHYKNVPYMDYLTDELIRFPKGKNDDIIDALAYAVAESFPPKKRYREERSHRYLY